MVGAFTEEWSPDQWQQFLVTRGDQGPSCWSPKQIESHYQGGHPYLLFVNEGEVAAIILYVQMGDVLEVTYLETLPQYRQRGLMSELLTELITRHPQDVIWLDVHENNRAARRLYQKMGFKTKGLRRGYYRDGGTSLLMEKSS